MFWSNDALREEEWSVSAKLVGGMVLNPFSLANDREDRLVDWFVAKATADTAPRVREWCAQPEYNAGVAGRNDWRVCFDDWQIVIECKLGDGISPQKDCLGYLNGMGGDKRVVVVAGTRDELALLANECAAGAEWAASLRTAIGEKEICLIAWHEIVQATITRVGRQAAEIISAWAERVERRGVRMMPARPISGEEFMKHILNGAHSGVHPNIGKDARGVRRSTAGKLDDVCSVRCAPAWVRELLRLTEEHFGSRHEVERQAKGWMNLCKAKSKLTLFPWDGGIAVLITHPDPRRRQPDGLKPLTELAVNAHVPERPAQWFPRDRTIGVEFRRPPDNDEWLHLVEEALCCVP